MIIGPVGAASASDSDPAAIKALGIIPGLQAAGDPSSSASLASSAQGFRVKGASGGKTTIERVDSKHSSVTYAKRGQTVIEGTSTDTDTVVQQLSGGARIIEVINSSDAPKDFPYQVDVPAGMKLVQQSDGSLLIGTQSQVGDIVTLDVDGVIGAPWAVDANGKRVATSYQVSNDGVVTMHVEHSQGVAYPVVADPSYSNGGFLVTWSVWAPTAVTVYLNKARTSDAEDGGALVCIGIAFVPVVGPALAAICAVNQLIIRAGSRYGFCQVWNFNLLSRAMTVGAYRGGSCT